jgi:hypothetical protein
VTAFICIPKQDRVDLLSDGACYSPDGTVMAIGRKVVELPNCSAAFVLRGDYVLHRNLKSFALCNSFRELVELAEWVLPEVNEILRDHIGRWEIVIAGVEQEPAVFCFQSWGDGLQRIEDDNWIGAPETSVRTMLECGFQRPDSMLDFDAVTHGIPLMEAFRRTPEGELYGVGGLVSHTEISRDRVETRIIHQWPDRVGERIAP